MSNSSNFHNTIARTNKTVSFSAPKFLNDHQESLRDSTSSSIQEPETIKHSITYCVCDTRSINEPQTRHLKSKIFREPGTIKRSITYCVCDTRSIQEPARSKSKIFSLLEKQMDGTEYWVETVKRDNNQRFKNWGTSCMSETFLITSLYLMCLGIGTLIGLNFCASCPFDNQRRIVY